MEYIDISLLRGIKICLFSGPTAYRAWKTRHAIDRAAHVIMENGLDYDLAYDLITLSNKLWIEANNKY